MTYIKPTALAKVLLFIAFFLLGFYFINAQVILVQEFLVVLFGNELCIGAIMASWFIGMTVGAWIASYFADRAKSAVKAYLWLQIVICLILPLQIYMIRILRNIAHVPQGENIPFFSMLLSTLLIILPISFLVGFIFPFACKVLSAFQMKDSVAVGWVYIVESVGSLVGGLLLTFYMIAHFKPYEMLSVISTLILANGIILSISLKNAFNKTSLVCYVLLLLSLN